MISFVCFFTLASGKCLVNDKGWEKCPDDKYWSPPTVLFVTNRLCTRDLTCQLEVAPKRNSYDKNKCIIKYILKLSSKCEALLVPGTVKYEFKLNSNKGYYMRFHRRMSLGKQLKLKSTTKVLNSTSTCNELKDKGHLDNKIIEVKEIKEDYPGFELYNDCVYRSDWSWPAIEQYFYSIGGKIFTD